MGFNSGFKGLKLWLIFRNYINMGATVISRMNLKEQVFLIYSLNLKILLKMVYRSMWIGTKNY